MLCYENDLRRAPETQSAMECAEASVETEWMDVVEGIQKHVVKEFLAKYPPSVVSPAITLQDLRSAAMRYPDIAHWVKYNRARRGKLKVGDNAPNVPLRRASTCKKTKLLKDTDSQESRSNSSHLVQTEKKESKKKKPTVIAAGSIS